MITQYDLDELSGILHPDEADLLRQKRRDPSQGLTHNSIEDNIIFNSRTFQYSNCRPDVQDKKMFTAKLPRRGIEFENLEMKKPLIDPILRALGLNSNLSHGTKDRKTLDARLRAAILPRPARSHK